MNNKSNIRNIVRRHFVIGVFSAILFSGISCASRAPAVPQVASQSAAPLTLNVALYPWVPDAAYIQEVVTAAWNSIQGAPPLVFNTTWDCYSEDPLPNLDVFVFDAIFASYFSSSGYLRPYAMTEIQNQSDYLPYALAGCMFNNQYIGLPQIGCTDILYYRPGDQAMANVQSLSDLWNVLGAAQYTYPRPPQGVGFMMDLSGGTTDACEYLNTWESYYKNYTQNPPLPSASNLDPKVMVNLGNMVTMAGPGQASYSDAVPYQRAAWFDAGAARAMVGFTEAMSAMPTLQNTVQFKPMPHADGTQFALFYLDIVGVNAGTVGTAKETWAVQLANLITSTAVISQAFAGRTSPQYLMPVRQSVLNILGQQYSQYAQMNKLILNANPQAFRIGPNSRNWLNANKDGIRQEILSLGGATVQARATQAKGKHR